MDSNTSRCVCDVKKLTEIVLEPKKRKKKRKGVESDLMCRDKVSRAQSFNEACLSMEKRLHVLFSRAVKWSRSDISRPCDRLLKAHPLNAASTVSPFTGLRHLHNRTALFFPTCKMALNKQAPNSALPAETSDCKLKPLTATRNTTCAQPLLILFSICQS